MSHDTFQCNSTPFDLIRLILKMEHIRFAKHIRISVSSEDFMEQNENMLTLIFPKYSFVISE